jgi:hypothetical protein
MSPQTTTTTSGDAAIRPFEVHVPEAQLDDLRRRVAATQWPEKETVADQSQGVPLAMVQELARHWATDTGWPGSIIEQLKIIDRLTDPKAPRRA